MCGDSHLPPAPESGDLVAVIHPNSHSHLHPQTAFRGRIRLSNKTPGATTSTFEDNTCNESGETAIACKLDVRIHKYGQLLSSYSQPWPSSSSPSSASSSSGSDSEGEDYSSNPILHSFIIDTLAATSKTGNIRLNLGVGGDGIVGRAVSVFDQRTKRVLGEGIIGWC
ncbi:hypothetical protein PV08_00237 [Exophiala spinifera]|uniref:Uncharacterized protein n=1 Tax=Exophiala spinifera TaxID=91928 RepID=A0A0D2BL26_9EURO|nr:uncharacterized protein PV08_00237 [Exophiala spinifera]KIW19663.1 hypothetical protein PV08_00237 [Exophiala spinifera]